MMIHMARGKVVRAKKTLRSKKRTCAVKHKYFTNISGSFYVCPNSFDFSAPTEHEILKFINKRMGVLFHLQSNLGRSFSRTKYDSSTILKIYIHRSCCIAEIKHFIVVYMR